jgi:uncharacterized membrane protein (DUF2068 family)
VTKKKSQHTKTKGRSESREAGLRIVALFEGAKGALVLLTGFGLLLLIHKDLHQAAAVLIRHFHFNPASKYPRIFLDLADRTSDAKLWAMACAAVMYSAVRFAEAIGLWLERRWAEWFGLLTGAMYLPVELFELAKGLTWPRVIVFVINVFVVSYLLYMLSRRPKAHKHH